MQLVTFSEPQAPFGVGDTRLVPDDVAEQLRADGVISAAEPWPPQTRPADVAHVETPRRPIVKPTRPTGGRDQRKAS